LVETSGISVGDWRCILMASVKAGSYPVFIFLRE